MKIKRMLVILIGICFSLSACSTVDSVRVFDDEQAAKLLQQSYTSKPSKEMLAITISPSQWRKIDLSRGKKTSVIFVPPNENALNWTRSIQTRSFAYENNRQITAIKFAKGQMLAPRSSCQFVHGDIIKETANSTLYYVKTNHCQDDEDCKVLEIGKAFNGRDGVYAVLFISKVPLTKQEFASDLAIIEHATLEPRT